MGHDAFFLVDVITGIEERITCMTYHEDLVYLGTANGRVLMYRTTPRSSAAGRTEYSSVREKVVELSGSSRSPVQQVEAMPDLQVLLVLCDGAVTAHRLSTLEKMATTLESKHAVGFAINGRSKRLCVVSAKKRLKLYEWVDGKFAPVRGTPELEVPDVPRAIAYVGGRIALGYQREYNVLSEDTGEVHDIAGSMARDTRPLIKTLPGDRMIIICAYEMGVILNTAGETVLGAPVLQFGHRPLGLAFCYPYVLSAAEGSTKVEVHASRRGKDETVQQIPIPGNVVGICDGRMGGGGRFEGQMAEHSKGRNPVLLAFSQPGRVVRLQPVPVDRQVEEMIRQYQVSSALELIVNTAEPSRLGPAVARVNLDAGRVFFVSCHFEQAFPFLTASSLDPRELLQMFPDLLMGSTRLLVNDASQAAASAASGSGSGAAKSSKRTDADVIATACAAATSKFIPFPSRIFSVPLTQDLASGSKLPSDAASEAADARGTDADLAASVAVGATMSLAELGLQMPGGRGGAGAGRTVTGVDAADAGGARTAVADILALVRAALPAYTRRLKALTEDGARSDLSIGSQLFASMASTVEGRLLAVYELLLSFLRQRRAAVKHAMAVQAGRTATHKLAPTLSKSASAGAEAAAERMGMAGGLGSATGATTGGGSGSGSGSGGSGGGAGSGGDSVSSGLRLPAHMVIIPPGPPRFLCHGTAFAPSTYPAPELSALLTVLDSAIMKLFAATRRYKHLDRMLYYDNHCDLDDAAAFLRAQGKYHSLALLYAGKGMAKEALSVWRELGTGAVGERVPGGDADGDLRHHNSTGSGEGEDGEDEGYDSESSSDVEEDEDERIRHDSLSDFEDVLDNPALSITRSTAAADGGSGSSGADAGGLAMATGLARTPGKRHGRGSMSAAPSDMTPLALALGQLSQRGGGGGSGSFDGIEDSIQYLRTISEPSIVFAFAEWLLQKVPQRAMLIFTSGSRSRPLADDAVLDYLLQPKFSDATKRNPAGGVVRMWLEHLVFRCGREEEKYHTRLAREYFAAVQQLRGEASGSASSGNSALTGTYTQRPRPGMEGGMLGELRSKLVYLLQSSRFYNAPSLLAVVKDSSLYEERVILHAMCGQHDKAMRLLVNELADHHSAVRYCELMAAASSAGELLQARGGAGAAAANGGSEAAAASSGSDAGSNGDASSDPFLVLLSLYLDAHKAALASSAPAPSFASPQTKASAEPLRRTVYLGRALELLSSRATLIDPLPVAKLLPSELPLHTLRQYFDGVLPAQAHAARESSILWRLYNQQYITTNAALIQRQRRYVTVTRNTFCFVCDKRIGESVFAVLPDNRPVHFHCQRQRQDGSSSSSGDTTASATSTAGRTRQGALFALYTVPAPAAVSAAEAAAAAAASSSGGSGGGGGGGGSLPSPYISAEGYERIVRVAAAAPASLLTSSGLGASMRLKTQPQSSQQSSGTSSGTGTGSGGGGSGDREGAGAGDMAAAARGKMRGGVDTIDLSAAQTTYFADSAGSGAAASGAQARGGAGGPSRRG